MSSLASTLKQSPEATLAVGLAAQLDAWGFGTWHADPAARAVADPCPILIGPSEPAQTPDERLLVTVRPFTPTEARGGLISVGLNYRGQIDAGDIDAMNYLAALYRRLHRYPRLNLGTTVLGRCFHESSGLLGADSRRRPGASANYTFRSIYRTANT